SRALYSDQDDDDDIPSTLPKKQGSSFKVEVWKHLSYEIHAVISTRKSSIKRLEGIVAPLFPIGLAGPGKIEIFVSWTFLGIGVFSQVGLLHAFSLEIDRNWRRQTRS
ncbi:unnamed protein product, partial [Discosporangium mesarthrocarpum]